jgi:hypothetical protein
MTDKAVEAVAEALFNSYLARCRQMREKPHHSSWSDIKLVVSYSNSYRDDAHLALSALLTLYPGIAGVIEGTHVAVPKPRPSSK